MSEIDLFEKVGTGWVYGEVTEQGVISMMESVPKKDGVFVDLGSGRGLIPAYLSVNYNFHECYGVELSERRHNLAVEIQNLASKKYDLSKVRLINQNLFDYDLSNADVIFTNNLAFGNEANSRLFSKVQREAKDGSYFICNRQPFDLTPYPRYSIVATTQVQTSWMEACPLHIFRVGQ